MVLNPVTNLLILKNLNLIKEHGLKISECILQTETRSIDIPLIMRAYSSVFGK